MRGKVLKGLIITGDDFGLSLPVNEAIEEAHRRGILTSASLMVGAKAASDAVNRAGRLPSLRVGLHMVLVDGRPVLPPEAIPDLVDRRGEFSSNLPKAGLNFFLRHEIRRQMEAEIRAQFREFGKTGLPLDHVNAHHHMHLHPTVGRLILKVGSKHGVRAMRLPYEPPLRSWHATRKAPFQKMAGWLLLYPWITILRKELRQRDILSNDFLFGFYDSGNIRLDSVLCLLSLLPEGITEICFHPTTGRCRCPGRELNQDDSYTETELEALTNPSLLQALEAYGIQLMSFCDLGNYPVKPWKRR
jgi:hopanoid biosynthesis associated protein HpnK